jgi:hypothetical protein
VYLSYIDDSGRRKKDSAYQVLASVLVPESFFISLEISAATAIMREIPEESRDLFLEKFKEFKAVDLYNGHGPFDPLIIKQEHRFGLITYLLRLLEYNKIKVVYGAVDRFALERSSVASANSVDICFRLCAEGIETYLASLPQKLPAYEFALFIADEFNSDKAELKASFRAMRPLTRPPHFAVGKIFHVHDEMYFGDSKESIGLQLADLCAYFIAKHLEGAADPGAEGFYKLIEPHIVYCKVQPTP